MTRITRTKRSRWNGKGGFIPPGKNIILRNPHLGVNILPFTVCLSPGELINWRTREKKALKRLNKTGSPFPFPLEFYPQDLLPEKYQKK